MIGNYFSKKSKQPWVAWMVVAGLALSLTSPGYAKKKKKDEAAAPKPEPQAVVDTKKLVWPQPPDIARVRWVAEVKGEEKPPEEAKPKKKKQGWMDRLAGVQQQDLSKPALVHFLS